jgi:hypothetical protein
LVVDGEVIPFVSEFKYLGSVISSELKDVADVDARIKLASACFAAAKSFFASKAVHYDHKKIVYEGLVLSILLYGSESWALTNELCERLKSFHNRCIRSMCRVTQWHHQQFHLRLDVLEGRLKILPLEEYLARRRLRWAGCLVRMDFNRRIPRKLLSSWIPNKRPVGRPQTAYGHGLKKDIENAGVDFGSWFTLAADENTWEDIINRKGVHIKPLIPLYFGSPVTECLLIDGAWDYGYDVQVSSVDHSNSYGDSSYAGVISRGPCGGRSYAEVLLSDSQKHRWSSHPLSSPVLDVSTLLVDDELPVSGDSVAASTSILVIPSISSVSSISSSSPAPVLSSDENVSLPSACPRVCFTSPASGPRRSARIAAKTMARGGRRLYSNNSLITD